MNLLLSTDKYYLDIATKELVEKIRLLPQMEKATVYYEYPLYMDLDDNAIAPSLMIISPYIGVVLINCNTTNDINQIDNLDDAIQSIENSIFAKLIKSPLKKLKSSKRELSFNLESMLFLPMISESQIVSDNYDTLIYIDNDSLVHKFESQKQICLDEEMYKEICSILEGSKAILKPKTRQIPNNDVTSKGYILKKMEEQIALLDIEQKGAALAQINGPQRIRGLAGSGKTIILCMKAALIHLREPSKKILYTFMTRSLYDYIETTIIRFFRFFGDGTLPDFEKIQIRHSWGGRNIEGVYYSVCKNNGVLPLTFNDAKQLDSDPFDAACENLLEKTNGKLEKEYDYVLIDEAQDFKPSFYQICRAIVKNDCLVWCYDDFQNIFNIKIQDTIETFKNKYGANGIDLAKLNEQYEDLNNDVVLSKTYRNPREILVLAHAIGFGIYNSKLIQSLENTQHWTDFGYKVLQGNCNIGDDMIIERPEENSPLIISKLQNAQQLIELKSHENFSIEIEWVVESIEKNIKNEFVRPDDIIVISMDDVNSKTHLAALSNLLNSKGIETFNITSNLYSKGFSLEGSVTLSTVYKAKGNEAAIVYVIGTQVFNLSRNSRSMRNKFFTAFTRSKGWLKISGINIENSFLWEEINCIIKNDFVLKFKQTETSYKIQRDKKSKTKNDNAKKKLAALIKEGYSQEEIIDLLSNIGNEYD